MKPILTLIVVLNCICFTHTIKAQQYTVKGVLNDVAGQPIDHVVCSMRSASDSLFIRHTLSTAAGAFDFTALNPGTYQLIFTHISYEPLEVEVMISSEDLVVENPYVLQPKEFMLDDVSILAKRPIARFDQGKIIYSAPSLSERKITSNAWDLLRYIPNIIGTGDKLKLVGALSFSILVDGKPSTLSQSQILQTLQSIPASQVQQIEVMYSTPPQYNLKGASVNIVLKKEQPAHPAFQGQLAANYLQVHRPGYGFQGDLSYDRPKYSIDFSVDATRVKNWNENLNEAVHQLHGATYNINQDDRKISTLNDLNLRAGIVYNPKNESSISLTYTANLNGSRSTPTSQSSFLENGAPLYDVESRIKHKATTYLHNLHFDYQASRKLSVGIDYTNYSDTEKELYREIITPQVQTNESAVYGAQAIHKVLIYVDKTSDLGKSWMLNYGLKYAYSTNRNNADYYSELNGIGPDSISRIIQRENNGSAYVGIAKDFGDKLSIQASFTGGIYYATLKGAGTHTTLWNNFEPLVNCNVNYNPSKNHNFQLSFSSDISYPPYWALSTNVMQFNPYSYLEGNPGLKFSREYTAQLAYILFQKYMIVGYYSYIPDQLVQLPYQSSERLRNTFQMINMDYSQVYGISAIVPFQVGKVWESTVTVNLSRQRDRDLDFNGIAFRKSKNSLSLQMDNTFNISAKPNIKAELSAFYVTGGLQGLYDISGFSSVTAGVKWVAANNRFELTAQVQDIFKTSDMVLKINYMSQHQVMHDWPDTPYLKVRFAYKFGHYVKKPALSIDKSRFGK